MDECLRRSRAASERCDEWGGSGANGASAVRTCHCGSGATAILLSVTAESRWHRSHTNELLTSSR